MELEEAIKKRKSVRRFSSKKPDWRNIIEAIHSSQYAPMAGGIFHMKFMVIDDKKLIDEIAKWSEQDFVKETKYVVVAVADPGMVTPSFPKKGENFSKIQAGAAIENFLLTLTDFGLSTCWIGHFNEGKIAKLLKIPTEDGYIIEAIFPIGYQKDKGYKKERKKGAKLKSDIYNIMYFNEWYNERMRKIEKIDARGP